ncbi:glycosyltransferase family 2 protein [Kordia jejudonensis]|uniref:glycosyltransferase family 2 protein n=1 Tax=Kordia jejudonensis TaxID=1348245 RepID=UPI0006296E6C|nr:glycosyltransferase family 2 protein [Kordia jejudonensis]
MNIIAVVVTYNRCQLLKRALESIYKQQQHPATVFVVSNSDILYEKEEQSYCELYGFEYLKNSRTPNYSGALNTAIEAILKTHTITNELYVAFLDDDDAWHSDYLATIAKAHTKAAIYLTNINRISYNESKKLTLPSTLSYHDFLTGNPGVGGSNTFVQLKMLLQAGCFDEAMVATVDRDIFVRLFQLQPSYCIIPKHLVDVYVDTNRVRVTTNRAVKKTSYQYFYYKYKPFMSAEDEGLFFERAITHFSLLPADIKTKPTALSKVKTKALTFEAKGDYQFSIGFIVGDIIIGNRILKTIYTKNIAVDLILIINNTVCNESHFEYLDELRAKNISCKIISKKEWKPNLRNSVYGTYFSKFSAINSIPIGRTLLQYHLYHETTSQPNPVYWIIDDDVAFTNTFIGPEDANSLAFFEVINTYKDQADALIGSVSKDPPLPTFSCMRGQLVDVWHSIQQRTTDEADFKNIRSLSDYYYDLSDAHSHHVEAPIYFETNLEEDLQKCFSGKAISRFALQKGIHGTIKLATNRGPNTLVFNRELLRSYPVINLEVDGTFVRRGDLSWALMNQAFSNYTFVVHSMSLDQNRPLVSFDIKKELNKSANDIIGYAFNKALLVTITKIKKTTHIQRPIDIINAFGKQIYSNLFYKTFEQFVAHRRARFLMNYYRIYGLLTLMQQQYKNVVAPYKLQFDDAVLAASFEAVIEKSLDITSVKKYLENLGDVLWSYTSAMTNKIESETLNVTFIKEQLKIADTVTIVGKGSEGKVFTDKTYIYKVFFAIRDSEWTFLKQQAVYFNKTLYLEQLHFFEIGNRKYIRYPYHAFKKIEKVTKDEMIQFLSFCYQHTFVFTNIKPQNFIRTHTGQLKLIDYGKSFESYTEEKFINSVKRACLLIKCPTITSKAFKELTKAINTNKELNEIVGWEQLWKSVQQSKIITNTSLNT